MTKTKKTLFALLLSATAASGSLSAANHNDVRVPDNRVVYSVYLRNYTSSDRAGTFNDLRADLPRIKDLGIDVIHLLPFYEMGKEHAKGSPYCIRDYNQVDPRYGTMDDLKALIDEIHANGMEIWFDWVGNHTAYDHPWVKEHPDWYTERQDFDDVRSVNSSNEELRKAMAEQMKFWVDTMGIDGYRCDFAHAPGRDFWVDIVERVDPEHKLFWLAEGNEYGIANDWMRAEGGPFDSRYGWSYSEFMYMDENDRKDQTFKGDFDKALFHLGYPNDRATFLTYIGSHDIYQGMEPQVKANTQDAIYGDNLYPITIMTMLAPGIPMVYMGQEINYSKPGGVGIMTDNEAIDWTKVDKDYLSLIESLIKLRHTQPALQTTKGLLVNHATDNDSIYVFERRNGDESVIAMLNLSYNPQQFTVTSPVLPQNSYTEVYGNAGFNPAVSASYSLPGKGYAIFTKDEGALQARQYQISIKFTDPVAWANPTVTVSSPDPFGVGGDLAVIDNEKMEAKGDNLYVIQTPYLPDFGYKITFTNGKNSSETISLTCDTPMDIECIK